MAHAISNRAHFTLELPSFKRIYTPTVRQNEYDAEHNPEGFIDLGRAENKLCEDIMLERLSKPDLASVDASSLYYPPYHGKDSLREVICRLLNDKLQTKQRLRAQNMIVTSGVGAALDMLAHAIGDPADCVLCPSPYYTRIKSDVAERSQLNVVSVPTEQTAPDGHVTFTPTVEKFGNVYDDLIAQGNNVCGIVLLNPHNPIGDIYSLELVQEILTFAAQKKIHVIVDEIYALSVFEGEFQSSVLHLDELPDPERTHFLWGVSKDFGLSGYRMGVIHSWNATLLDSIRPLSYFGACSASVQNMVQTLLSDREWIDKVYFPTNYARMRKARDHTMQWLDKLGVSYTVPRAGFFIWADFSKFLATRTEENHMALFMRFFDAKVYMEPGRAFYCDTPGYFRVVFTLPRHIVDKAFEKIERVLKR